jgi:hypothetical protein
MSKKLDILKDVYRKKFLEFLREVDGHDLYDMSHFTEMKFPEKFVKKFSRVHKSDGTYKGTIFDKKGNAMKSMRGVFDLTFVRAVAYEIGADTAEADSKMGRGFAARCYASAIVEKLGLDWFEHRRPIKRNIVV